MFRVLALDGGGIRGAAGAAFLESLEQQFGAQFLAGFDLVCGTSTGAIIAASVASGLSASRIREFYQKDGERVFKRRPPVSGFINGMIAKGIQSVADKLGFKKVEADRIFQSAYLTEELAATLAEYLGGAATIESLQRRLLITALDLRTHETLVFESKTHDGSPSSFGTMRLVDAVLASAAAPTFFEPRELQVQEHGKGPRDLWLTDGGLWANNPALAGLIEALKVQSHRLGALPQPQPQHLLLPETCILSVGTGLPRKGGLAVPGAGALSRYGYLWWARPLLPLIYDSQSTGADYLLEKLKAACGLRYLRVDFELTDDLRAVDAVDKIPELLAAGARKAAQDAPAIKALLGLA